MIIANENVSHNTSLNPIFDNTVWIGNQREFNRNLMQKFKMSANGDYLDIQIMQILNVSFVYQSEHNLPVS
jgi:hypothetical protein